MSEPSGQPMFRRSGATVAILVVAVSLAIGYSLHERSVARQNIERNQQATAALAATQGDVAALTAKINSMNQPPQAPEAAQSQTQRRPAATVRVRPQAMKIRRLAHHADDPRWKKVQAQLDEQGKQIESTRGDIASTRSDLSNARTELSGSIARTHDELIVLQKKGERNYYEFDIAKSKDFKRNGPMGIRLRKANTKGQYADLQLMVDDVSLTKKHVNLYEPAMFYTADGAQPAELVINSITKDRIRGYISEPKYRRSELAAMSTAATPTAEGSQNSAPAPAPVAAPRKKLELPQN